MWHGLRRFLLFLLLVAWWPASAVVLLPPEASRIDLAGHMNWLRDDAAQWTPDEAAARTGWRPLSGEPSFGFTRSAIWLRMTLRQPGEADSEWRLVLNNALLEDVRLYVWHPADGRWREYRAGQLVPRQQWPMHARSPVFQLSLPPGDHP